MTNVNPSVLLRSLIIYAVVVPLAIIVGYALANPMDYQTIGFMAILGTVLIFPLLMKAHYTLLIFSCNFTGVVFFLPGHPNLFLTMVAISLTISVIERILTRQRHFLPSGGVGWALLFMLCVVIFTAKMNGGFGLRSMGSNVYGGKKYIFLITGILSFFAFTARPIPRKEAGLYLALFFGGGFFCVISDLYAIVPSWGRFIFMVFPPAVYAQDPMGGSLELGVTRLMGIPNLAGGLFFWTLARHGFRESFLTPKLLRPIMMFALLPVILLGGFRSSIIGVGIMLAILFYLEKMHRTGVMLIVLMVGLGTAVLLVPVAPHLPYTFQRALAFLPLDISPEARMNAQGSTEWRLEMWKALLPQVPKYLLLGKGYSFSRETFDQYMTTDATFHDFGDAALDPLAMSSDFHSGPLSVLIPFGLWGALAWLWFWAMGFRVLLRNHRYGDPPLRHINLYLLAAFISKCIGFLFIFGGMPEDIGTCSAMIGLSIAFNHGVMAPRAAPQSKPAFARSALPFTAAPALPR